MLKSAAAIHSSLCHRIMPFPNASANHTASNGDGDVDGGGDARTRKFHELKSSGFLDVPPRKPKAFKSIHLNASAGSSLPHSENLELGSAASASTHASRHPLLYGIPPAERPIIKFTKHDKVPRALRQIALDACCELELRSLKATDDVKRRNAALETAVTRENLLANRANSRVVYSNQLQKLKAELSRPTNAASAAASAAPPAPAPLPPTEHSPLVEALQKTAQGVHVRGAGETILTWEQKSAQEGMRTSLDCSIIRGSGAKFFAPLVLWLRAEADAASHHRALWSLPKQKEGDEPNTITKRAEFHRRHAARLDALCEDMYRPAAGAGKPLGGSFGHSPVPLPRPADPQERALWHPPNVAALEAEERAAFRSRQDVPLAISHDAWLPEGWRAEQAELRLLEDEEDDRVSA